MFIYSTIPLIIYANSKKVATPTISNILVWLFVHITSSCALYHITPFIFPFLADVQFWRSRKSLEGLSVRSVFFNVFQSFVVLLYILDNETNTVVIISVFVGESWELSYSTLPS